MRTGSVGQSRNANGTAEERVTATSTTAGQARGAAGARPSIVRTAAVSVAVGIAYVAASASAMALFPYSEDVAVLWPSAGIALAAVLIWGPRLLPAVFVGSLCAELLVRNAFGGAFADAAVTTGITALAHAALTRVARIHIGLRRVADVLAFTLLGAGLMAVCTFVERFAILSLRMGTVPADALMPSFVNALALGAGVLYVAPVCLAWAGAADEPVPRGRGGELGLFCLAVVALSLVVFSGIVPSMLAGGQLPYALFPVVFWGGLRFGVREVAGALFVAGLIAVTCTAVGKGPFAKDDVVEGLVVLYLFLTVLAVTSLMLAAALRQRTEADAAVRDSERRWRLLLERMNEGLMMQDRDGAITYVSDRFCEITGYAREQLLGRTGRELIVPEETALWAMRLEQRQQGVSESYELTLVRGDGERMAAYISPRPLFGEHGEYVGSFALLTDVTERRRAEARLRESEAKYRLLVENQTDLIVTFDRAGALTFASPSYRQLFGADEAELLGRPVGEEIHEDDRGLAAAAWTAVWSPPYMSSFECRVMTPQGWRWLAWSARAIGERGDAPPDTAVAVARDVTDRRRAEDQARQHLQSLAHVARVSSMGEMASAIAHEINQPLTAIANYAYACVRLLRGGKASVEEALEVMQRVAAEAERAGEVVRKMRSFVRGDEGQLGAVDPNFLVTEVLRLAAPEARQSGVELAPVLAADAPQVLADSIQIQQVLLNLVRNAVEAIASSDAVERAVTISTADAANGRVEIAVADTGPGLAPDALERVFEPFFTTKPDGIGIGLALSRSIVDAHGGRLWASARPGGGAVFHLQLPAAGHEEDDRDA
jgi:PAS domain S-box-containing protein